MNNTPDNISSHNIGPDLIHAICQTYQLGKCLSSPQPCSGGLLHRIWKIDTGTGQFIIKLLNPAIINRPNAIERYRITEHIARSFAQHISIINALTHQSDPLFFFNNHIAMVFPYINASPVLQGSVTLDMAEKIGKVLAQMHTTSIDINSAPEADEVSVAILVDLLSSDKQKKVLAKKSTDIVKLSHDCHPIFQDIQDNHQKYAEILKNNLIISHRDCDSKNVLWDDNHTYYIIDWESAGLINKTKDLLVTATYWSFDDRYNIDHDRLIAFLQAYQKNKGIINRAEITAGLYGLLGDWLSWLDFNLSRILNNSASSEEFKRGEVEAIKTMTALPVLFNQLPTIIRIIETV